MQIWGKILWPICPRRKAANFCHQRFVSDEIEVLMWWWKISTVNTVSSFTWMWGNLSLFFSDTLDWLWSKRHVCDLNLTWSQKSKEKFGLENEIIQIKSLLQKSIKSISWPCRTISTRTEMHTYNYIYNYILIKWLDQVNVLNILICSSIFKLALKVFTRLWKHLLHFSSSFLI